ncbi:MAG: aminotransferase class V-fold PLP-dependent enzyme [Cytophagaceae bacterium]|nr:aminotransferase class V-fold PLP-dependent enzyme [Gemmatimonadaceae bacterium]
MGISRRSFVATAASLAAAAKASPAWAAGTPSALVSDDPLGVRADFPVASTRTYLNSAYIAPVPRQVVAAGQAFVEAKAVQPISLGDMLRKTNEVRAQFARLVNAGTDEIGFLFSTSEGENIVANSLDLGRGDNVVIDELHYETEFVLYREMEKRHGIELRVAKHRDGVVTAKHMEPLVDKRTRLVSVAWVSHQNGYRHDLRPIADLAHAHGALCYVDGIQAVGMFPTDVKQAGIDFLCAGTYKWLLGSFGVAPFYIRRELLDRVRLDRFGALHVAKELPDGQFEIHKTARRFDYSTLPFCEVYQLGAGLAYLEKVGVSRIEQHTVPLAHALREGLVKQGYRVFTPPNNASSIVSYFVDKDPAVLRSAFEAARVDVTVRDTKMVRVSPALFNTDEDIARFLDVTRTLV